MAVAKVWNGSEWVPTKWKTYNGSEWVEQSKVWDGSKWVPIKGAPPVTFDAVGPGGAGQGTALSYNLSWTHTASGEGRAVVVPLVVGVGFGGINNIAATYGGIPMTALTERGFNNSSVGRTQQFILLNPPTGAQTVQVTVTHNGALQASFAVANSVSYNNVGSYTQGASSHGSGTSRTLTVTTASEGDMVAQAFGNGGIGAMSSYSQTQRSSLAPGGVLAAILIGDSDEGDNNISFTATGANGVWSGVSVILHPA